MALGIPRRIIIVNPRQPLTDEEKEDLKKYLKGFHKKDPVQFEVVTVDLSMIDNLTTFMLELQARVLDLLVFPRGLATEYKHHLFAMRIAGRTRSSVPRVLCQGKIIVE